MNVRYILLSMEKEKNMKINDFIYNYKQTICRVRTYVNNDQKYFIISELKENQGPSVTNSIEFLIQSLVKQGFAEPQDIFIEHYPKCNFIPEEFDEIKLDELNSPKWCRRNKEKVMLLINENISDFDVDTNKNQKNKIDIFKNEYTELEFIDYKFVESPNITMRREKNRKSIVSKEILKKLIKSKASEYEIGSVLKKDLSIFAEAYAKPSDEYICFSEFPFFDKRVDFVVFTGRSSMKVFLIEIKGADNKILNKNSYGTFSHKFNEGMAQLYNEFDYIQNNKEMVRKEMHRIRQAAIDDEINCFKGPKFNLNVDPNKTVTFYGVLICGYTDNDLVESNKRHSQENEHSDNIIIETWDSFINKLI